MNGIRTHRDQGFQGRSVKMKADQTKILDFLNSGSNVILLQERYVQMYTTPNSIHWEKDTLHGVGSLISQKIVQFLGFSENRSVLFFPSALATLHVGPCCGIGVIDPEFRQD
jgi:hypothetical protein